MITIQNRNQLISIESVNAAMSRESDDNDKNKMTDVEKQKLEKEIEFLETSIKEQRERKELLKKVLIGGAAVVGGTIALNAIGTGIGTITGINARKKYR